jgi:acyl-coenzyme A synthetase/AMP-(fatty) acid ligase
VAVVGVEDKLKGQVPMAFAVVKDAARVATPELVKALERKCSRRWTAFWRHRPPGPCTS